MRGAMKRLFRAIRRLQAKRRREAKLAWLEWALFRAPLPGSDSATVWLDRRTRKLIFREPSTAEISALEAVALLTKEAQEQGLYGI